MRLNWLSKNHYILLPKNWCNLAPLTWNFPSKNIGVGCHFLFQGIFPSQGSNPYLLHSYTQSTPCEMPGGMKHKLKSRLPGEISTFTGGFFSPVPPGNYDLNSAMTVLVRSQTVKGGTSDVRLDVWPRMSKKVVFFLFLLSFPYENNVLPVLRAEPSCLPTCTSHKHSMLINSLFTSHFVSCCVLPALNLNFEKSRHHVSSFN